MSLQSSGVRPLVRTAGPSRGRGSAPGRRRLLHVLGAAVVGLLICAIGAAPAWAASTAPVYPGDFPDPVIVAPTVTGGTYWAFATGSAGRNLQVMSSSTLSAFSGADLADPLPTLPSWAQAGYTWAPAVLPLGGTDLMYYTVRETASGRQCVSVASSQTGPRGPYQDSSTGPLVCQLTLGGSIDPATYTAADGTRYLLWKSDENALGNRTRIWGQRLSSDGRSLTGTASVLLTENPLSWQYPAIEGPSMIDYGGTFYLFYGANRWDSSNAGIGYAVCRSPVGPCTDKSASAPWMASHGNALGPSGPALFKDVDGSVKIAYHAWTGAVGYNNGGVRSLWVDTLKFRSGKPTLA